MVVYRPNQDTLDTAVCCRTLWASVTINNQPKSVKGSCAPKETFIYHLYIYSWCLYSPGSLTLNICWEPNICLFVAPPAGHLWSCNTSLTMVFIHQRFFFFCSSCLVVVIHIKYVIVCNEADLIFENLKTGVFHRLIYHWDITPMKLKSRGMGATEVLLSNYVVFCWRTM